MIRFSIDHPVATWMIFTARVSPINEESLYFQKSGYVKVVYVEKGDWVEEGEVLADRRQCQRRSVPRKGIRGGTCPSLYGGRRN